VRLRANGGRQGRRRIWGFRRGGVIAAPS
jgi:hypothetical protein